MMGEKAGAQGRFFHQFDLDEVVPGDHRRALGQRTHLSHMLGPPMSSPLFQNSMSSARHATARRLIRSGAGKRPSLMAA